MEQMTQELNMDNHNIKTIKKLYNDSVSGNTFLNAYTMLDVEDGKKHLFTFLMKKYDYKNSNYIQDFVEKSSLLLAQQLFSSSSVQSQSCVDRVVASTRADLPIYHTNHRIITIDSCYRENLLSQNQVYDTYASSDMIVDLNDTLDNLVSLELANICIPFTFYNISKDQGNNYFYVYDISNGSPIKIEIDDGNYSNNSIISKMNDLLNDKGIDISFEIDDLTNKVSIASDDVSGYTIFFYDNDNSSDYSFTERHISSHSWTNGTNVQSKVNHNLGWLLGFRNIDVQNYDNISYEVKSHTKVTAEALCHLPYTKYFIIVIDDMNKNQSNKSLVQINNGKSHINKTTHFKDIDNSLNCLNDSNFDNYVNSSGRSLTKNQLYSSLQVNNYRASFNETNSKLSADLINNVFAVVPFETKSLVWGNSMYTSDKNKFIRKYNSPVDISKLSVKLLDDRGNLLNLNGAEWSLSMISTHSYEK